MVTSFAGDASSYEGIGALICSMGFGAVAAGVFACFTLVGIVIPFLTFEASYRLLFDFAHLGPAVADCESPG